MEPSLFIDGPFLGDGPHIKHPPDTANMALLLDVDGTLIEIAATPQAVRVPPSLKHTLSGLRDQLDGALCLVSGRPIADLDRLFDPLRVAIVGGHGAEIRTAPAAEVTGAAAALSPELRERLLSIATDTPGLIAEEKSHSLALHYRLVPEQEKSVRARIDAVCARWAGDTVEVLPGKSVFEVKPRTFNKGVAIRTLMQYAPFQGRRPVFLGDDVTDESAFRVMPEFDGLGFSVGRTLPGTQGFFATPREVRHWLYGLLSNARATA